MGGKKRIRSKPINRNRCIACKIRNKRCDLNGEGTICSYCEKRNLKCELPTFTTIVYQGPQPKKARSINQIKEINELIQKDQHENLNLKESIILNYLGFSIQQSPDLKHWSTIRSNGFFTVYDKKLFVSQSSEGNVLDEKITEIPLVDMNTNFEKRTGEIYGIGINDGYKFFTNIPEYRTLDFSNNLLELKFEWDTNEIKQENLGDVLLIDNIDSIVLKNEIFLEAPSLVVDQDLNSSEKFTTIQGKFVNLPKYIPINLIKQLLDHFCIAYPEETSKVLYATNDNQSLKDFTNQLLTTHLTLAFSNIVVFKTILLWSAFDMELKDNKNFKFKSQLKNEIIKELNSRAYFVSSVCCDHMIAIELLLYEIQALEVAIDPHFWFNLNYLLIKSISMRGGLNKLSDSDNGKLFRKIFCSHYFTRFCYNIVKYDISALEIEDVEAVFNIPAIDGLSPYYISFKNICAVFGETFHLHGLMKLAKNSSHLNDANPLLKYQVLNSNNIIDILSRSQELQARLNMIVIPDLKCRMKISTPSMKLILEFMKESTVLLFNQLIYNYTSSSAFTLLQIKKVIPLFHQVLDMYLKDTNNKINIYLVLPIFLVGCDLFDSFYRNWFIEWLDKLYFAKRHAKFLTIKKLVLRVWEINRDGNTWVSWPEVAEARGLILPLYV